MREKVLNHTDVRDVHTLGNVKEKNQKVKRQRNTLERGITLIALVVTLFVQSA